MKTTKRAISHDGRWSARSGWRRAVILGATSLLVVSACSVNGEGTTDGEGDQYPEGDITLIVPYAPGGTSDVIGRYLAKKLETELGTTVVVQNQEGGGGAVGWHALAAASPDGYTLGMVTKALVIQPHTTDSAVDWENELRPVAKLVSARAAVAVSDTSDYESLDDLFTAAQAAPDSIRVSNSGAGATWDLFTTAVEQHFDISVIHVPYEGANPAVVDVAGGHVDATFMELPTVASLMGTERLRMIGVNAPERLDSFPNVPTFAEQGYNIDFDHWTGLAAPAGVPDEILIRLDQALSAIVSENDWQEFLTDKFFAADYIGPDDWPDELVREDEQIRGLVD